MEELAQNDTVAPSPSPLEKEGVADGPGELILLYEELVSNPLNIILIVISIVLVLAIVRQRHQRKREEALIAEIIKRDALIPPKMKSRDFTLEELKGYDGTGPDHRVLIAVNGKVFDVTRGKNFYGPGGPYHAFSGKDASRALATFSVSDDAFKQEHDDLSDLTKSEFDQMKEWELQFTEKYDYIGKLLKPGEEPTVYSDGEPDKADTSTTDDDANKKDD